MFLQAEDLCKKKKKISFATLVAAIAFSTGVSYSTLIPSPKKKYL